MPSRGDRHLEFKRVRPADVLSQREQVGAAGKQGQPQRHWPAARREHLHQQQRRQPEGEEDEKAAARQIDSRV
jgi:hypothetical protein